MLVDKLFWFYWTGLDSAGLPYGCRKKRGGRAIETLLQSRELTKMLLVFQLILVYYYAPM